MVVLSRLYSDKVLYYAGNIPHCGRLSSADFSFEFFNRLCGSRIRVDYNMKDDRFTDFAQEIEACALGQTSASIVGHNIIGESWQQFMIVARSVRSMLEDKGKPPMGKWQDFAILSCVHDFTARHGSVMLVFDAIEAAKKRAVQIAEADSEQNVTNKSRQLSG